MTLSKADVWLFCSSLRSTASPQVSDSAKCFLSHTVFDRSITWSKASMCNSQSSFHIPRVFYEGPSITRQILADSANHFAPRMRVNRKQFFPTISNFHVPVKYCRPSSAQIDHLANLYLFYTRWIHVSRITRVTDSFNRLLKLEIKPDRGKLHKSNTRLAILIKR